LRFLAFIFSSRIKWNEEAVALVISLTN
jgi:hypothetical protein